MRKDISEKANFVAIYPLTSTYRKEVKFDCGRPSGIPYFILLCVRVYHEMILSVIQSLKDSLLFLNILFFTGPCKASSLPNIMGTDPWLSQDMCNDHIVLNDSWRGMGSLQLQQCDKTIAEGWYRFITDDGRPAQLPVVCIKNSVCGVSIPLRVDLRGQMMPSTNQTKAVDVCGSYSVLGRWDCCVLRQPGYIHNCGRYYVYKLKPPDRCSVGFCVLDDNDHLEYLTVKTGELVTRPEMRSHNQDGTMLIRNIDKRDVNNAPMSSCPEGERRCSDNTCVPMSRSCNYFHPFFQSATVRQHDYTFSVIRHPARTTPPRLSTRNRHQITTLGTHSHDGTLTLNTTRDITTTPKIFSSSKAQKQVTSPSPLSSSYLPSNFISGISVRTVRDYVNYTRSSLYNEIQSSTSSLELESSTSDSNVILESSYNTDISKTISSYSFSSSSYIESISHASYDSLLRSVLPVESEVAHSSISPYTSFEGPSPSTVLDRSEDLMSSFQSYHDSDTSLGSSSTMSYIKSTATPSIKISTSHEKSINIHTTVLTTSHPHQKEELPSRDKTASREITASEIASHLISSAIADVIGQIGSRRGSSKKSHQQKTITKHTFSNQVSSTLISPSKTTRVSIAMEKSVFVAVSHGLEPSLSTSQVEVSKVSTSTGASKHTSMQNVSINNSSPNIVEETDILNKSAITTEVDGITSLGNQDSVTLIFTVQGVHHNNLDTFTSRLHYTLVNVFNRFYHRSYLTDHISRHKRNLNPTFEHKDIALSNMTLSLNNVFTLNVAIGDVFKNSSGAVLSKTNLFEFFNNNEVIEFIENELSDFNASLIDVQSTEFMDTTSMAITVEMDLEHNSHNEPSWFFANFGLFLVTVLVSSSCIVCSAIACWQLHSWSKCRGLRSKSGNYYVKCEQALLREVYKSILTIESPLSDAEIKKDEDQMTEEGTTLQPVSPERKQHNKIHFEQSIADCKETGWIVPISEFLDDVVQLKTEITKL